jgi:bacterioferritin-associated ferredoxin
MYVCICNAITQDDIKNDPSLIKVLGTKCGSCMEQTKLSAMRGALHEYRDDVTGDDRWALVYGDQDGSFNIQCFINQVYKGTRHITGHTEVYAENAAENFVLGLFDTP